MGNFDKKNIDFARQCLLQKISRPLASIALYPQNSSDTTLSVQIVDNASVVSIKYIATTTTTGSVNFVGKSIDQVVLEINQLGLPIKAVALTSIDSLAQGDLLSLGADYLTIPDQFSVYDRTSSNGIFLRINKLAVKHKSDSKIKLLSPYLEDPSLPWYPRITNGSFTQVYNNKVYHYYIAEYDDQVWSMLYGKPFKDLKGVSPILVDKDVYQLPRYPVYWNGSNITIYNGDVPIPSRAIQDIDINNGLIYINPEISLQDNFTLDYSYLENTYVYPYININGHFSQNPLLLNKYVVIYIIPIEGSIGSRKRTIFHTIGDSVEEAIDSIKVSDPLLPFTVIGAYSIQQIFASDKASILDTRARGGGLKRLGGPKSPVHHFGDIIEEIGVPIEQLYTDANRFWDIGNYDGEPYPGAAAVSINIPEEIKSNFDLSEIRNKASKFLAAGIYPVIRFSERDLPSITGMSSQVSCAYNLQLDQYIYSTGNVYAVQQSMPEIYSGAGWLYDVSRIPTSVVTGDLTIFDDDISIIKVGNSNGIRVTDKSVKQSYLKSTPFATVSWYERELIIDTGNSISPLIYSPWVHKKYYDTREVNTGELAIGWITLSPENTIKEYTDIDVHSPYHNTQSLSGLLEGAITDIFSRVLDLQYTGTETYIKYMHASVNDSSSATEFGDYHFCPSNYYSIFDLNNTPLESVLDSYIDHIGSDLLTYGIYNSGMYFKYFIQSLDSYIDPSSDFSYYITYSDKLDVLNKYLRYRYNKNTWSGNCDTGFLASTGIVHRMLASTLPEDQSIPIYWLFTPQINSFSGYAIPNVDQLGGTLTEINPVYNYDQYYNNSLPTIFSTLLAHTGSSIDSVLGKKLLSGYSITSQHTVENIEFALNSDRTISGLFDVETHWAAEHNRLSSYLGNTVFNMTKAHDYIYEYLSNQESITNVYEPSGASPQFLKHMFSGIERVLDAGYEGVYSVLTRGGVVGADIAKTLYGYGWYLNNWEHVHGLAGKTYTYDNRAKYESLFNLGLKQLVKNHFTIAGGLYESTYINNEVGPFNLSVPTKVLYPLAQALEYSFDDWKGIAQGFVTTLVNNYSIDGLYYTDPLKSSDSPGTEYSILPGLAKMYKVIASSGQYNNWEPVLYDLSNIRAANFLPVYENIDVVNTLSMWGYYNSGDILTGLSRLKDYGINTVKIPLDYGLWYGNSGQFFNTLDHFFDVCQQHRLRVIPTLYQDQGNTINSLETYTGYGHTGTWYGTTYHKADYFLTGSTSGEHYVSGLVQRYDNHPALIAWNIADDVQASILSTCILNSTAYYIKQRTQTPIIICLNKLNSYYNINTDASTDGLDSELNLFAYSGDAYYNTAIAYNPNYDFIAPGFNNLFAKFIDIATGSIHNSNIILNNIGDATYGSYDIALQRSVDRSLPYISSNIYITSYDGLDKGVLYRDGKTRSSKQLGKFISIGEATGSVTQELTFDNKIFYSTGFTPSYNVDNLLAELSNWNNRSITNLTRELHILRAVQSGLDDLNFKLYSRDSYYIPDVLTEAESNALNYYRTESLTNTGSDFISQWGSFLYSVCNRIGING